MKIIRFALVTLTLAFAGISSANAHDSFSVGINIGGPGYYAPPPVRYYPAPPPVYYAPPPAVYYSPAPRAYYGNPGYGITPRAQFRYYDEGSRREQWHDRRHYDRGWR